ncbi:MAG TPA: PxKF domain-containing protein [Actinomycetota bacterium]|nr:PxKF domain-containing protein [Actinomycetota bacterium]
MTGALADGIEADADALVAASPHANDFSATQAAGDTVAYDFSAQVKNTGNSNNDVFSSLGDTVSVTIVRSGDWLATDAPLGSGSPSPSFTFSGYDAPQAGTIRIKVPSGTAVGTLRTMTVVLTATASNGKSMSPSSITLSYHITAAAGADGTPPSISYTLNPTAPDGANGWYKSDVSLTWTVTENESPASLVKTGCVDQSITSDQGSITYSCEATSDGGSAGPVSVSVKRDATAPTINASLSPPADAGTGWYNIATGYPTVSFTCSDDTSGIPAGTCPGAHTFNSDGANQSFNANVSDAAGNSASAGVSDVDVDLTAPGITFVGASPAPNGAGWNNTDVVLTWSCSDDTSGAMDATVQETIDTDGPSQAATGTCYDNAGNSSSLQSGDVFRDTVDPTITASLSPADPAATGWYNIATGAPTVSFSCDDDRSGIPTGTCPASHTFGNGANQSFSASVFDAAGNQSDSAGVSNVDVDLTAPGITFIEASPGPNGAGWNNSDVTLSWACTDGTSGAVQATVTQIISTEGSHRAATGTCYDNAGNSNSLESGDVNLDKTEPTLTWNGGPAGGGTYVFGSVPSAPTCEAHDGLSGPKDCAVSGYSAAAGSHTMTATAHDNADNTGTETRSYTVLAWTLRGFYQPVDMNGVYNVVKGGSTVPLKFEVFAGLSELTDTSDVKSLSAMKTPCPSDATFDEIEVLSPTGGTSLRYDTAGGQFIYNWQTPKPAGVCYRVTMTTQDDSTLVAFFKTK